MTSAVQWRKQQIKLIMRRKENTVDSRSIINYIIALNYCCLESHVSAVGATSGHNFKKSALPYTLDTLIAAGTLDKKFSPSCLATINPPGSSPGNFHLFKVLSECVFDSLPWLSLPPSNTQFMTWQCLLVFLLVDVVNDFWISVSSFS